MQQVEARKTMMLQQKASKFASVQAKRIKTMRQLVGARKYVEKPRKLYKQNIVERYANFGSTAYAPVQREGRFPELKPQVRRFGAVGKGKVQLKEGWLGGQEECAERTCSVNHCLPIKAIG
jgi:hypothetical protein